jgi:hypothetical protein
MRMPSRRLLLAVLVAAPLALPAGASARCRAGVHSFGSVQARTFCGPASVAATIAGARVTLKGGQCDRTKDDFSINIGTVVLGTTARRKPDYFGITVGRTLGTKAAGKDGVYPNAAIALDFANKGYAVLHSALTLRSGRSRGTFAGRTLEGKTVSGTFRCG